MGLSMHDRQVLADIEQHLTERDPALARLLGSFGDRRSRLRAAVRHAWLGTVVVVAGLAFLLGMVLLSTGSASRDRVLTVCGGSALIGSGLLVVAVLVVTWRRRRAG
ncbi:DUF3040 domain-containing protein [Peterkaempfera bronchialis]|uniref:DUF3040 domain-containing protein n=1 Tax=Peterkaempfera bronchialis TaxID=2126346 RepID=A0A345T239_9ACTN|nr:DUF3040 domain-containing protein [Peterkaempfera bronchialis]AXI80044.1 DUF3040 domain-containing protein [Peterkaempfera bronchialis]